MPFSEQQEAECTQLGLVRRAGELLVSMGTEFQSDMIAMGRWMVVTLT